MLPPFSTPKLNNILRDRRLLFEQDRQYCLNKTREWLDKFGSEYGIDCAYIFGSITRPY